jgi:hypothetical protein
MIQTSAPRLNAIDLPSLDHAGEPSGVSLLLYVNASAPEPSALTTQIVL